MPMPSKGPSGGGNKGQSDLFKKLGKKLDEAVKKHADDDTKYGIIQIPAGISNGIAKLEELYFAQYKSGQNEGEYYMRGMGVIMSPETVMTPQGEMKVQGLQTSIMVPVCETKTQAGKVTPIEDNVANVLNEMRKLAGDDFTKGKTGADLEAMAAAIQEAGPYFKFTTTVRKAQKQGEPDGVWENWHGSKGLENYEPETAHVMVDETGAPVETQTESTPGDAPDGEGSFSEFGDLTSLVEKADAGDVDAQKEIVALAEKAGITEEQMTAAKDYAEIASMLGGEATTEEAPAEEEAPAQEWEPAKEETYKREIEVIGPGKKKMKKKVDIEILTVDKKTKTVTAKDSATQKVINGADKKPLKIKWEDLLAAE